MNKALKDEGVDFNLVNPNMDFPSPSESKPSYSRNSFEDLYHQFVQKSKHSSEIHQNLPKATKRHSQTLVQILH